MNEQVAVKAPAGKSLTGPSKPVAPPVTGWRRWTAGLPMIGVSVAMSIAMLTLPQLSEDMSITTSIAYRAAIVLFGVIGAMQLAIARSPIRGMLAMPGFGRNRVYVPVEGVVYIIFMFVVFTGAMLTKYNMLLMIFALMAGPFVVNGSITFGMLQAARITRAAPKRAMSGELFDVAITLANRRPFLAIWVMTLRDQITFRGKSLYASILFTRVGPRKSREGHYQLRLEERGRHTLGPIVASSRFPLGLIQRSRTYKCNDEILIYPRIGHVHPVWKRRWIGATELVSRSRTRTGMFHDDFHRLREFRVGDNPRDIHWRTSARRGELTLREYQQSREFSMAVVLDLWRDNSTEKSSSDQITADVIRLADMPRLEEQALSLALSLIIDHGRSCQDRSVTFAAAGATTLRWKGQAFSSSLEPLFDGLALLEAGRAAETFLLLEETLAATLPTTQIVLVTTRPGDSSEFHRLASLSPRVTAVSLIDLPLETVLFYDDELDAADEVAGDGPTASRPVAHESTMSRADKDSSSNHSTSSDPTDAGRPNAASLVTAVGGKD